MPAKRISSADLGIDVGSGNDREAFRWLVACQLFGARISQQIAARTFAELDKAGLTSPRKLANADWQHVVDILGKGGYRRYDESTARELIAMGRDMVDRYGGSMKKLRESTHNTTELAAELQRFKGIGPTATSIFLRDMSSVWS